MGHATRDGLGSADLLIDALHGKSRRRRTALDRPAPAAGRVRNDLVPNLALIQRSPEALTAPARAVRKRDIAQVERVAASIRALGFCDPVLIDGQDGILDGVARVEAAKLVGLSVIPCIVAGHLTPGEQRALRLALNRLQERGGWDLDELKLEFEELALEDGALDVTGFTDGEIDQVLLDDESETVEPGPLTPSADAAAVARSGDVFVLGRHRVICGDARDPAVLAKLMGEEGARLLLTDEPYNVPIRGHVTGGEHREFAMASGEMTEAEFQTFNLDWIGAALPHLVEGGVFGTFIDWRGLHVVQHAAAALALSPLNLIVWAKTNAGMGSLYRSQHELLQLFKKGKDAHVNNVGLGRGGRWRSNLWTYPGASSLGSGSRKGLQDHPTVKPVALLADALLDLTARDEVVLDPFLGSGSTLIAAERTGRRCYGVEIDPHYVDLIVRRYEEVTGGRAIHEADESHDGPADWIVPRP
ncbi:MULTISPECIES: DNA methyltransferase [unclassified Methylobacterium]|uniref:site-specific DNA-methyltransferase n=1 Tax=unclassified Methylobacterium TaxID=2615210 RepID=UPI00226A7FCF|nr:MULTISPECIES: DNA methyltransferase [unclassified Methylobacterium]